MYSKSDGDTELMAIFNRVSFMACAGLLSFFIIFALLFPNTFNRMIPYRFYNVLTDSMEPKIETNSLALVKTYDDSTRIEKDDIIIFSADRFGEQIVIMHRFSHTEINEEGELVYRTRPEVNEALDVYETKSGDILGVYLCHIPYAGKWILFLKSAFGFLWLCQIAMILLIKELIYAVWEEKGKCHSGCGGNACFIRER